MNEEEKREYEELKSLLYTGTISQYGKRKLIDIIEKQQKEIERIEKKLKRYQKYLRDSEKKCDKLLELEYTERERDYISKDKIRELKEKYRNDYMTININNRSAGKTFKQAVNYEVRKVIDELLGE